MREMEEDGGKAVATPRVFNKGGLSCKKKRKELKTVVGVSRWRPSRR